MPLSGDVPSSSCALLPTAQSFICQLAVPGGLLRMLPLGAQTLCLLSCDQPHGYLLSTGYTQTLSVQGPGWLGPASAGSSVLFHPSHQAFIHAVTFPAPPPLSFSLGTHHSPLHMANQPLHLRCQFSCCSGLPPAVALGFHVFQAIDYIILSAQHRPASELYKNMPQCFQDGPRDLCLLAIVPCVVLPP